MGERLGGRLLIAAPALRDPNFAGTVVALCHHDAEGAMGIVINRPHERIQVADIVAELMQDRAQEARSCEHLQVPVFFGGPVEPARGFVLHDDQSAFAATMPVAEGVALTASRDVLQALIDAPPRRFLVALGYAGWAPGQLEAELKENAWLIAPMDTEILFSVSPRQRWKQALGRIGIDPAHLSSQGGHA